jgi:hypothetical protein
LLEIFRDSDQPGFGLAAIGVWLLVADIQILTFADRVLYRSY